MLFQLYPPEKNLITKRYHRARGAHNPFVSIIYILESEIKMLIVSKKKSAIKLLQDR
jgi:hypothetical protein